MVVAMRMLMAGYPKQLQAKQGEPMKPITIASLTLATALAAPTAFAAVSAQDAAKLGSSLTPVGAEVAGNAAGTIPEWTGGITTPPPGYEPGMHHLDPFADDEVLFRIDASNYQQYADQLSVGQKAMFERYPDTCYMNVYPTRRSASFPQRSYDMTIEKGKTATLVAAEFDYRVENVAFNEEEILAEAEPPPFPLDERTDVDETIRLRHRYVDLRKQRMPFSGEMLDTVAYGWIDTNLIHRD